MSTAAAFSPWAARSALDRAWRLALPALLLLLALCVLAVPRAMAASGAGSVVELGSEHLNTRALVPGLALLRQAGGPLSPAELLDASRARDFVAVSGGVSGGYTRQTYWLRLRVQRADDAPNLWWLRLDRGFLDEVRLYHRHPDGRVDAERRAGDRVQAVGALNYRAPAFVLDLSESGIHEIYLGVRTDSAMVLQPSLTPEEGAVQSVLSEYLAYGLYFGVSLSTMCIGLASAIWLRQSLGLLYALLVLSATFSWFAATGLAHQILFDMQAPLADRFMAANIGFAGAVGVVFYSALFELRQRTPRLWRLVMGVSAVLSAAALAPLLGLGAKATPAVLVLMFLSPVLFVPAAVQIWREGQPTGRAVCLTILVYQALAGFNVLLVLGLLTPGLWVDLAGPIGNLVHIVSLLLVGAVRVREGEASRRLAVQQARFAQAEQAKERAAREDQNQLLSMLAHEIRTPIAIVDASLQSLRLLDPEATPQRLSRHERIGRAVDRMSDLLELALTRDRLDVSAWQQNFASVDLAELTHEVINAHSLTAERTVDVQAAPDLPCMQADGRMLRYALLNLIDNALKYSPRDKPVDITIRTAEHNGRPGLLWTVQDQGQGIAAAQAERIFDKYFRAGDNARVPGIGLGLYLVRQIVSRHQGWVRAIVAEPGRGGCFECWLPLAQAPITPAAP